MDEFKIYIHSYLTKNGGFTEVQPNDSKEGEGQENNAMVI